MVQRGDCRADSRESVALTRRPIRTQNRLPIGAQWINRELPDEQFDDILQEDLTRWQVNFPKVCLLAYEP